METLMPIEAKVCPCMQGRLNRTLGSIWRYTYRVEIFVSFCVQSLIQHHLSIQQDIQDRKGTVNGPTVLTPCIHFIETAPSVLRDVSWIQFEEHKVFIYIV